MQLFVGKYYEEKDSVKSVFRLAGKNEDALTYALGYLLAYDSTFCDKVVKHLVRAASRDGHPKGKRPADFKSEYAIHLQEVKDRTLGRRDIVIESGGTQLVIEAKIEKSLPEPSQVLKYVLNDDGKPRPEVWGVLSLTVPRMPKSLIAAIESEFDNKAPGKGFGSVQWDEVLNLALSHMPNVGSEVAMHLFREFLRFAKEDYRMDYYDAEVSIQDVDFLNSEIYKQGWMYVTAPKDKRAALYFAPYFARQGGDSGITMVSRVLCIENLTLDLATDDDAILDSALSVVRQDIDTYRDHWCLGLQKIRKRGEGEGWSKNECRLLFLDQPIQFRSRPLTKKDLKINNQIPKGFSLTFQELLGAPG